MAKERAVAERDSLACSCNGMRKNGSAFYSFREKIPSDWLPKILPRVTEVLIDDANLEREAATTA